MIPTDSKQKLHRKYEHFADLSDTTRINIHTSSKKLRIDHIKPKIKNANDNHRNYRINSMIQNKKYTGTNDKNRKVQFSKITKHNKRPKSCSSSK